MTPGKLFYLLVVATALALTAVYQSNARLRVGYRLDELRSQIVEQRAESVLYQAQLSKLKNPQRILRLVAWLGLDLEERRAVVARAEPNAARAAEPQTVALLTTSDRSE